MHNVNRIGLVCAVATTLSLGGCDPEFLNSVDDTSSYTAGAADFSSFVTLGDSLTAGFADSALYLHGQQNSYPAIIAKQLQLVGGGNFTQPLVSDNLGGLLLGGNVIAGNRLVLSGTPLAPAAVTGAPTTEVSNVLTGPFNNMGVPGAKSFHLGAVGYGAVAGVTGGTANPYYARMASSATATMIADTLAQAPTFFILWIGNNDTLSYATSGGVGTDQLGNPDPTTYGANDLTDPTAFAGVYSGLVTALTAGGAKGVLVNLPDVTSSPFLTTVPFNAIPMDAATAAASNAAYTAYNAGVDAALGLSLISTAEAASRKINFAAGQNAVVIEDESLTDITAVNPALIKLRQATASDFIVLTASSIIGALADPNDATSVQGVGVPLGTNVPAPATDPTRNMKDALVLTASEAALVATANAAFNATIAGIAAANADLALFDAAAFLAGVTANGFNYGTGAITGTFATGGGFSLDGAHPTARGYAVAANQIIDVIEAAFGAVIPPVDPGEFTTTFVQ